MPWCLDDLDIKRDEFEVEVLGVQEWAAWAVFLFSRGRSTGQDRCREAHAVILYIRPEFRPAPSNYLILHGRCLDAYTSSISSDVQCDTT